MDIKAVRGRLAAVVLAVIAKHLQHAKPVVAEQGFVARVLCAAVSGKLPPFLDRGFTFKKRNRQQLVRMGRRLEPFDADKAVNLSDKPSHLAGYFQIVICHALVRGHFENDRDQ